ncbi:MAG: tetratricopeptide repeat protein [Tepidisphaeraceae bacterium]
MQIAARRQVLLGALLALVTILAYLPAIRAGFVWDDPDYVLNNQALRSTDGLGEMWTNVRSLPQWYPLVHTSFWIEYHLWGLHPLGYHLDNVLLHITAALLLWRLLRMLDVPGCYVAGAIFALHPAMVESVAWVTERKNVLSMVFYLLAARAYLRFDRDGNRRRYLLSFAFFASALLSKTVTATLPCAILLVIWWTRGRVRLRDVARLVPFFVLGVALALLTSWLERSHVGADGTRIVELDLSLLQRVFIAGRAVWFYLWKLLCPLNLTFIYPRWESVERAAPWLWTFPVALVALIGSLFALRREIGRACIVAVLFYCGTLFPALGFVNVYPMRFTFVADHFQYHASIGIIALVAAVLSRISRRLVFLIVIPLAVLTYRQARMYHSAETLWRETLTRNPRSWMVWTNLGNALAQEKRYDEAIPFHERALALAPHLDETHWNVGVGLMRKGKTDLAEQEFQDALRINPDFAPALDSLGKIAFFHRNDPKRAEELYLRALNIAPYWAELNYDYGVLLERTGRVGAAIERYRIAAASDPDMPEARYNLGSALINLKQFDEAIFNLQQAVRIDPKHARAWTNLGAAQLLSGRADDAEQSFRTALSIDPGLAAAQRGLQACRSLKSGR